ncbi:Belongs to the cyclin [Homalodisca vitripennis]|nr:Belongs to the cyclin [Homalodisca vitripennis]
MKLVYLKDEEVLLTLCQAKPCPRPCRKHVAGEDVVKMKLVYLKDEEVLLTLCQAKPLPVGAINLRKHVTDEDVVKMKLVYLKDEEILLTLCQAKPLPVGAINLRNHVTEEDVVKMKLVYLKDEEVLLTLCQAKPLPVGAINLRKHVTDEDVVKMKLVYLKDEEVLLTLCQAKSCPCPGRVAQRRGPLESASRPSLFRQARLRRANKTRSRAATAALLAADMRSAPAMSFILDGSWRGSLWENIRWRGAASRRNPPVFNFYHSCLGSLQSSPVTKTPNVKFLPTQSDAVLRQCDGTLTQDECERRAYGDPAILDDDRVLRNLLNEEDRFAANISYFERVQSELSPDMRRIVADWMMEVRRKYP